MGFTLARGKLEHHNNAFKDANVCKGCMQGHDSKPLLKTSVQEELQATTLTGMGHDSVDSPTHTSQEP